MPLSGTIQRATKRVATTAAEAATRRAGRVCDKIRDEWGHEEELRRAATAERMQRRLAAALGIPVASRAVAAAPR